MWLTRVRGVPLAGEALGFGELGGGHQLTRVRVGLRWGLSHVQVVAIW